VQSGQVLQSVIKQHQIYFVVPLIVFHQNLSQNKIVILTTLKPVYNGVCKDMIFSVLGRFSFSRETFESEINTVHAPCIYAFVMHTTRHKFILKTTLVLLRSINFRFSISLPPLLSISYVFVSFFVSLSVCLSTCLPPSLHAGPPPKHPHRYIRGCIQKFPD